MFRIYKLILAGLVSLSLVNPAYAAINKVQEDGSDEGYPWVLNIETGGSNLLTSANNVATLDISALAAGSGTIDDDVTVNSSAVDTIANFKDTADITWALVDGGAGGPDDVQASYAADSMNGVDFADTITLDAALAIEGQNVTINDASADIDFRIESDDNANLIYTDGGNDIAWITNLNNVVVVDGTKYAQTDSGIEAAIAAAGAGGAVFLPPGTYALSGDVDIGVDNFTLYGVGDATFLQLANSIQESIVTVTSASNVRIANFRFDGNRANQGAGTSHGIDINGSDNVKISNLSGTGVQDGSIHVQNGSSYVEIDNCYMTDGSGDHYLIRGSTHVQVSNCTSKAVTGAVNPGFGIFANTGETTAYVSLVNCTAQGGESTGFNIEEADSGVVQYVAISNSLSMANAGVGFGVISDGSTSIGPSHVTLSNNISQGDNRGMAITGSDITISGNFIDTPDTDYGIAFFIGSSVLITGNEIFTPATQGIYISLDCNDINIIGNQVKRVQGAGSENSAIYLAPGVGNTIDNVLIYNNMLYSDSGSTQEYGIYYDTTGTLTDIFVMGNHFEGNQTADTSGIPDSTIAMFGTFKIFDAPAAANDSLTITHDGTNAVIDTASGSVSITDPVIVSSTITFPDNTRQTFNPGANASGLNVGSQAGDPDTLSNGDIWYDSTGNTLDARINGSTVSLGAGGGYTNLTQFVDQTAWRVFYSDTDGDMTELALGADGTFLKSNGATSAPTFATPAGSGDITSVGDVSDGAAFDGTQGTTLTFNNAGGDGTVDYDGTDFSISKPISVTGGATATGLISTTIADTANVVGLSVTQNDTTNNPNAANLVNAGTGHALSIDQNGAASSSTSVGGAVLLENTGNTGAGLIIYSNVGATADGRLLNVRADNAAFDQDAVHVDYDGTADGLSVTADSTASNAISITGAGAHTLNSAYTGTTTNQGAANLSSTNTDGSTLYVSGVEADKGTIKVLHTGTGTDSDASALSIELAGNGSAAQGIFGDATGTPSATGYWVQLRDNGTPVFTVSSAGAVDTVSTITAGSGNIAITNATGNVDGEQIADDTIDDDSIDFADVTGADLTLTDAVAVTTSGAVTVGTSLLPDAADGAVIGSTSAEWSDLYLADGSVINFGADQDVTLTHVADTGLTLNLDLTISGSDLTLGAAGVKLTGDGDGAVTLLGLGDGSDEDMTINLDDTSNEIDVSSSTGVTNIQFNGMTITAGSGSGAAGQVDIGDAGGFTGILFDATNTHFEFYIDGTQVGHIDTTGAYTDDVA